MDRTKTQDPIERLNAKARSENWPSRVDSKLAFQHPQLVRMREVWASLAGGDRLPSRADFTFGLLKPFLSHVTILGITGNPGAERRYRHSYVGTEIANRMGEITGLCFEDFLPAELLPRTLAFIDAAAESRRPLRIVTQFRFKPVDYLFAEVMAIPLADDGATPNKLLSVTYFSLQTDEILAAEFLESGERDAPNGR